MWELGGKRIISEEESIVELGEVGSMGSFVEADDGVESSPELGTGVGTKIGWSGWDGGGPGGDGGPDGGAGTLTGLLSEAAGRSALGTGTLTGLLKEAAGIDANGAAAALGKHKNKGTRKVIEVEVWLGK